MSHKRTLLTLAAALAIVSGACGNSNDNKPADARDKGRTVDVEMVDVAFKPTELAVAKGETVRFVFKNNGTTRHEAFFGTPTEQKDHDKKMTGGSKSGSHDMGKMGDGETALTVDPGKTDEFTTRFADTGTFEIGCHQPGHYIAGMKITVTVS